MTPEQLAARVLADCPRWQAAYHEMVGPFMEADYDGEYLFRPHVLAAIARHLAPGDDLVERATTALEGVTEGPWKTKPGWAGGVAAVGPFVAEVSQGYAWIGASDADFAFIAFTRQWVPEAADRISALTAQVDGLKNDNAAMTAARDMLGRYWTAAVERADAAETEAATLRDRLARMEGEIAAEARRYAEFYPQGSDGQNTFVMFAEWVETRAALTDGGSNG